MATPEPLKKGGKKEENTFYSYSSSLLYTS